jgi:hypothetical protein
MIANHIHDALAQVRKLQEVILTKKLFKGYSGKARIASGTAALIGAAVLASGKVPDDPYAHLIGWGVVLVIGIILNYVSLLYWFLFDPKVRRNPVMLKPALDALPALAVGAALSGALILSWQFDLLFGMWMAMYGLAQVAYRQSLPRGIYLVGLAYIVCGVYFLAWPVLSFTNPWPMGIVFFLGEFAGGIILIVNRMADVHEVNE